MNCVAASLRVKAGFNPMLKARAGCTCALSSAGLQCRRPAYVSRHRQAKRCIPHDIPTSATFATSTTLMQSNESSVQEEDKFTKQYSFGPSFLSDLCDSIHDAGETSISSDHLDEINEEAKTIALQLTGPSDPLARTINIDFMAYMVAAYRILKHKRDMPVPRIRGFIEVAVQRSMQPMSDQARNDLDGSSDPFVSLVNQSKEKERDFFISPDFKLKRVRDAPDSYHVRVYSCWYMKTLRQLDALEIGPSFCAFDNSWSDCVDPRRHGFKFARPTTIAEGAQSCAFNFDRVSTS